MILTRVDNTVFLKYCIASFLLLPSFGSAQSRSATGQFSVSISLNGVSAAPAGSCISQTLFDQRGAVVRVTCVDNPFVTIAPSIDMMFPGTFGGTFRYPVFSSISSVTAGADSSTQFSGGSNRVGVSSLFVEESTSPGSNIQNVTGNNFGLSRFNSRTSAVTDMSIYRTSPQASTDAQGLMDMVISF